MPDRLGSTRKPTFDYLTSYRYRDMAERVRRSYKVPLPFSLGELRAHILDILWASDGSTSCRYCHRVCVLSELALDHAHPLSRGGGFGLDNIELPCKECNAAKGSMSPHEFHALLDFLEKDIPYARIDVLSRLKIAVPLAAGIAYRRKKATA